MDEYEGKIYQFVKKNPDCNENDVRNSGICSQKWARLKLGSLKEKGFVEDRRTTGFHKYRISDRTKYESINKTLDDIETQIKTFQEPLLSIRKRQDMGGLNTLVAASYTTNFVMPFFQSVFTRLFRLLQLCDIDIGKEDSLRLHSRIIPLIAKVTKEPFYRYDYKKILIQDKNLLNKFIEDPSKGKSAKSILGLGISDLKNLVASIEQFEKFEEQFTN